MAQKCLLIAVWGLSLAALVKAQQVTAEQTATPEEKEILKIEHEKIRAMQAGGSVAADWFDHIEADGLAQTMQDGRTLTKAQHVAEYRTNAFKAIVHDHYDYRVRIYNGNTAVVTYLGYDIDELNGKSSGYAQNETTDVFVKENGKWRTVVHHVTRVQPK